MLSAKKKKLFISLALVSLISGGITTAALINANEETVDKVTEVKFTNSDEMQLLYSNDNFAFSYRKSTTCLEIYDKRINYSWTTGANLSESENNELGRYSSSYLDFVNSFMETKAIMNNQGTTIFVDSADNDNASIKFYKVNNEADHFRMDITFKSKFKKDGDKFNKLYDIYTIKVHFYFLEEGMSIEIRNKEIEGEYRSALREVYLMPFLASDGGTMNIKEPILDENDNPVLDEENNPTYSTSKIKKPMENGYFFVPDGSGSLINFKRNVAAYRTFNCDVYGGNPTHSSSNENYPSTVVGDKPRSIPVYGCAKLDYNAAFVGYAEKGAESMAITVEPENGGEYPVVQSVYAYPKFTYNFLYTEVFNKTGANNQFAKLNDILDFDVKMTYNFLANEDANYSGMAKAYQKHLINNGQLSKVTNEKEDIPIRLDFLMADSEESVMGINEVVVTTPNQVDEILTDIIDNLEISNIVSSLKGWAKGGKSVNNPRKVVYSNKIGSKNDYKKLINKYNEEGIDISMSQDYLNVNTEQISFTGNVTKHVNNYYNEVYRDDWFSDYAYARPDKFVKWVKTQNKKLMKDLDIKSMSIEGISDSIVNHSTEISLGETMDYTKEAFKYLKDQGIKVNASHPNSYLFEYVDRYFDIPVTDSQYLIEDAEVPFLQMVLNGCMEMYADYSNFSFYNQNSILTMIDYNVSPSFILTNESSHLLTTTNSADYYSTEYNLYKDKINNIYHEVNNALSQVNNDEWLTREYKDGVYINTYKSGKKIYINYSSKDIEVDGITIEKESYEVR